MTVTNDDRIRQAEIDAARAREIAEESVTLRDRSELPGLSQAEAKLVSAKLVREFVRAFVVEPVIQRMYRTAMGIETFEVPTAAGNVVTVPALPETQVRAMSKLLDIGVPTQLGLVDDDGGTLPGVFALGPIELDEARKVAHGERYIASASIGDAIAEVVDSASVDPAAVPEPMEARIERGEFEIVEVDEGVGFEKQDGENDVPPPPAPITERNRLEQEILARRRARRAKANGNGATNGNGNGAKK